MANNIGYGDVYFATDNDRNMRKLANNSQYSLICTKSGGWELLENLYTVVAGEFSRTGLKIEIRGFIICDSLKEV